MIVDDPASQLVLLQNPGIPKIEKWRKRQNVSRDGNPIFGVDDALPDFSSRTGPFGEGVGEALPIPVVPILPGPFRGVGVGLLTGRPDMFPGPLRGGLDGSPGPIDCGFFPDSQ